MSLYMDPKTGRLSDGTQTAAEWRKAEEERSAEWRTRMEKESRQWRAEQAEQMANRRRGEWISYFIGIAVGLCFGWLIWGR